MVAPVIGVTNFGDLQAGTRTNEAVGRVVDIASTLTYPTFMSMVLKDAKIKRSSETGKSFTWRVMVNSSGSFANVPIVYQDQLARVDTLAIASADWRHNKVDWPEVGQEIAMNSGNIAQIVNVRLIAEKAAMISWVEGMENNWWGSPPAVTDTLTPWGVNTWLPKTLTYTVDGFNGTVPTGYTTMGLNPTTYPNWKNYYAQYTNVTDDDFVRRLLKAITLTNFKSLVDGIPVFNADLHRAFFTNYGVIGPLQELLKASNENLGVDIAKYRDSIVVNGTPVLRVPQLELDATNPFYGLCVGDIEVAYLEGYWMKKLRIPNMPGFHNIAGNFLDTSCQFLFRNRRNSFVMATANTYP